MWKGGGVAERSGRGRQWGRTKSCHINFTDIFHSYIFPPLHLRFPALLPWPETYLWGGQTDSAHALRAWVQAGILGLVQGRVHGEMLLAVHGHHHPPRKQCGPWHESRGRRTDRVPAAPHHQTELVTSDAPPGFPLLPPYSSSSFSPLLPPPLLTAPLLNLQVKNVWPVCASV